MAMVHGFTWKSWALNPGNLVFKLYGRVRKFFTVKNAGYCLYQFL